MNAEVKVNIHDLNKHVSESEWSHLERQPLIRANETYDYLSYPSGIPDLGAKHCPMIADQGQQYLPDGQTL